MKRLHLEMITFRKSLYLVLVAENQHVTQNLPKHLRMFVLHVPLEIKLFKLCKSENRKFQVNSFEIVGLHHLEISIKSTFG